MTQTKAASELDRPLLDHIRRDYVALHAEQTVDQAFVYLRTQDLGERVVYFFVVDADNRLVGVVPTRRLLMSPPDARIADLMRRHVVSLPASASLLLACEYFVMHRFLALPVVDDDHRLLGIVDVNLFTDGIFDLSERQAADDVFQLIGVRLSQSRTLTPWENFRRRMPWLLCNIAGGLGCALIAARHEALLQSLIVLALFVPIVLALGESVSMQSMTLTLQAMHQRRIDWRFLARSVGRELRTALLLGGTTGLIVGLAALVWKSTGAVAIAIGLAIALSILTACLLGVILTAGIRVLRGDPRIAAGPIVLAVADVCTLLLYFSIAALTLR